MSRIYKVSCSECPRDYVGQTKKLVTTRLTDHLREPETAIQNNRKAIKSMLAKHMVEEGHDMDINNMKILKQVKKCTSLDAYESL